MPEITLPANGWWPRPYQMPLWKFLQNGGRRAVAIWHRRAGKDEVVLHHTAIALHERVCNVWHCMPEYEQARKALWTAVNPHTGKRRIDEAFPPELRESKDEQQMFIRFRNGSTWQLVGSDRYDSLVGAGIAGVVFSEWALCNPSAWGYIRPIIEENHGWAVFITTPRGRNHAKATFELAQQTKGWFAQLLHVADTKALEPDAIDQARAEYGAMYGEDVGEAMFEQEYNCNWNAAIIGAFYAKEMARVRSEGRVCEIQPIAGVPVHRAWDIGVRDDTSIWFFQIHQGKVFVLDCYTNHGAGVSHYADVVRARGYPRADAIDYVPQDAAVLEWGSDRTRIEQMIACGLNPKIVTRHDKLDGINAARITLDKTVFHPRCEQFGLAALELYRREWDDARKMFAASEYRDWTTHLADAFRYLAMAWREWPAEPDKPDPVKELLKPKTWGEIIEDMEEDRYAET